MEAGRPEFDAALEAVQAAVGDATLVPALKLLAKASTKLAAAVPGR